MAVQLGGAYRGTGAPALIHSRGHQSQGREASCGSPPLGGVEQDGTSLRLVAGVVAWGVAGLPAPQGDER